MWILNHVPLGLCKLCIYRFVSEKPKRAHTEKYSPLIFTNKEQQKKLFYKTFISTLHLTHTHIYRWIYIYLMIIVAVMITTVLIARYFSI